MGLNELTGSNSITFIERSTPSNLVADSRRLGVGYEWVQGGTQNNLTFAVNYYAGRNVRFMLNYILVSVEDSGAVVDGIPVADDEPGILLGRVQFHF